MPKKSTKHPFGLSTGQQAAWSMFALASTHEASLSKAAFSRIVGGEPPNVVSILNGKRNCNIDLIATKWIPNWEKSGRPKLRMVSTGSIVIVTHVDDAATFYGWGVPLEVMVNP
jgi:hypothetical protein